MDHSELKPKASSKDRRGVTSTELPGHVKRKAKEMEKKREMRS